MAAGTVPVIIHLMFRRRAKTVYFPSIIFLRQLDREVIRRRRLQEILIMILRVLVLLLFVMFLAKPILRANLFFGESAKSVVVIIDDSYSMQAKDGRLLFDKAKERVISIIKNLRSGDEVAIILASGVRSHGTQTVSLSSDFEVLRQEVESLEPGYRSANLDLAFNRAVELLRESGGESTLMFLVTDMQRNDWAKLRGAEKENEIPLVVVDVGPDSSQANAVITDVEILSEPDDIARKIFNFRVKLRNFSSKQRQLSLGMYTGPEQLVDETNVDLDSGEEKEVRLVFRPGDPGWHGGYFKISDDGLPVDNFRYYSLRMSEEARVGIFARDLMVGGSFDQYFFLSKAIDPLEQGYPFRVDRFSQITSEVLSKFDVVVMPTVADFDSAAFTDLKRYIFDGGKALFFVERGFSKKRLGDLCGAGSEIGSIEKGIYKVGKDAFGLSRLFLDVDVYERVPISLPESSSSYVLGRFQDGKAFIIERLYGNGAFILVTTGYNLDMTNLPFRHASVPLLYEMLFRLMRQSETRQYLCGDVLEIEPSWDRISFPSETVVELTDADEEFVLNEPGLYVATSREGRNYVTSKIAAANVDPTEGDLEKIGYEEFERLVPFKRWERIASNRDIRQKMAEYARGTPLWNYFLYAAIILFFVEFFMANKAGRKV